MDAAGMVGCRATDPGSAWTSTCNASSRSRRGSKSRHIVSRGRRVTGALRRTLGFRSRIPHVGNGHWLGNLSRARRGAPPDGGSLKIALAVWLIGGLCRSRRAHLRRAGCDEPMPADCTPICDAFGPLPAFLYGGEHRGHRERFDRRAGCGLLELPLASSFRSDRWARALSRSVVIAVIALINIRGTRESSSVENWATATKVGALLILSVSLIGLGHGSADTSAPAVVPPTSLFAGLGGAMIGILWAYEGWQYVTFSAGETRDPQRVFPRAIAVATAALIFLYIIANLGYVAALGTNAAAASDHVAADACAQCSVRCPEVFQRAGAGIDFQRANGSC